jgi:hypothetical protein
MLSFFAFLTLCLEPYALSRETLSAAQTIPQIYPPLAD